MKTVFNVPRVFVGVDPGKTGALAAIDFSRAIVAMQTMPWRGTGKRAELDFAQVDAWIARLVDANGSVFQAVLEKPQPRPGEPRGYGITLGKQMGALAAIFENREIPYLIVPPNVWTRVVCVGMAPRSQSSPKDRKLANVARAAELFPEFRDIAEGVNKAAESGLADALLIAEYARQWWNGATVDR